MSEFVSSMMGNSLPTDTNPGSTSPLASSEPQQNPDGAGFPKLFASIDPEATTMDSSILSDPMNPFAPLPLITDVNSPTNVGVTTTALGGQTGNVLPQNLPAMSITGFVAHGDQDGAVAVSFSGDDKQMFASNPQLAKGLAPAIQQSQAQLNAGLQQQLYEPQGYLQNATFLSQNSFEDGKQIELMAEMARQANSADETFMSKPTTSSGFAQILTSPLTLQDASSGISATSRAMEPMTATLQQPHWNQQIGDRLNLMISRGLQQAEIRLNPPELGMLEVKVQIQGDQANVNFSTPHGQVKEALDAAIPRLREMLEENGLTLGDVNVSHQSLANGQSQTGEEADGQPSGQAVSDNQDQLLQDTEASEKDIKISSEIGMLDVFV